MCFIISFLSPSIDVVVLLWFQVGSSEGDIYTLTVPELRCVSKVHAFKYSVDLLCCSPDKKWIFASGTHQNILPRVSVALGINLGRTGSGIKKVKFRKCWRTCRTQEGPDTGLPPLKDHSTFRIHFDSQEAVFLEVMVSRCKNKRSFMKICIEEKAELAEELEESEGDLKRGESLVTMLPLTFLALLHLG